MPAALAFTGQLCGPPFQFIHSHVQASSSAPGWSWAARARPAVLLSTPLRIRLPLMSTSSESGTPSRSRSPMNAPFSSVERTRPKFRAPIGTPLFACAAPRGVDPRVPHPPTESARQRVARPGVDLDRAERRPCLDTEDRPLRPPGRLHLGLLEQPFCARQLRVGLLSSALACLSRLLPCAWPACRARSRASAGRSRRSSWPS